MGSKGISLGISLFLLLNTVGFFQIGNAVEHPSVVNTSPPPSEDMISSLQFPDIKNMKNRFDELIQTPLQNLGIQSDYVPGEIIVKLKDEVSHQIDIKNLESSPFFGVSALDSLNTRYGLQSIEKASKTTRVSCLDSVYTLKFSEDVDVLSLVAQYQNNPAIEYAEPNYIYHVCEVPDDPYFSYQWALNNTGQTGGTPDADIDAPDAWNITTGDAGIVIAVIDTGVDYTHSDLMDNIWVNSLEILDGEDNDSNGYIDDVIGWNFYDDSNDPLDDYGHGTHCAGIISARGNNSYGITGVTWNCSIMPLKALDSDGSGYETDLAEAIYYAADNHADIISMSWGGSGDSTLIHTAINYAASQGVVLVAAAGNSNTNVKSYPAAYDNVIAVAATNSDDEKASFSNWGSWVDIAAPGYEIYSTMPTYEVTMNDFGYNQDYDYASGTSMACPFVAGLSGLILSKTPSLNSTEVTTILKSSTEPVTSDYYIGIGRINAYEAVLRDSTTIAILNSSLANHDLVDVVNITGTANGSFFTNYSIYYSTGLYSTNWTKITTNFTEVNNSILTTWNTTHVEDGTYTLRLIVNDSNGFYGEDQLQVKINNVISTFYVGGVGPGNYTSIQDAINNASDRDTVYVYNGTYNESIMISCSIELLGENKTNTIIDAGDDYYGIWIAAEQSNISNFTIQNAWYGIVYTLSNQSVIKDNCVNNTLWGIYLISSSSGFDVNNSGIGGSTIISNRIENNSIDNSMIGIQCEGDYIFVGDNILNNSLEGIICESSYSVISNNTIDTVSDYFIPGLSGFLGIALWGDNGTIEHNTVTDQFVGIYLYMNNNCSISTNTIYNSSSNFSGMNGIGIWIWTSSNNNSINDNTINHSCIGINISLDSEDNLIYHNNFINNTQNAYDDCDNTWDNGYPLGGNYWDDYTGSDDDEDGIGDAPYDVAGGNNHDQYPLINPTPAPLIYCVDDDFTSSTPGWHSVKWSVIQDAIDNVTEYTYIKAYNGTYSENLIIDKSLYLCGNSSAATKIQAADPNSHIVLINDVEGVIVGNLNISGATGTAACGILLTNVSLSTIKNVKSTNNYNGISLVNSTWNTMYKNTISDNAHYGLYLDNSSGNIIYHNNFIDNTYQAYDNKNATNSQYIHWWNGNWSSRKLIVIDHSITSKNLTNFPVLFKETSDSDLVLHAQDDGDDIAFILWSDNSTQLNHEIEYYNNTSGELWAWINITRLSNSNNTKVWMYYGNPDASNQQNSEGVWDSNYAMVQHLNETSGTHNDSTSYNNNGYERGGVTKVTTGKIDGADSFDGSNDHINVSSSDSLNITGNITVSAWIKPVSSQIDWAGIVSKRATADENTDPYNLYALSFDANANKRLCFVISTGTSGSQKQVYSTTVLSQMANNWTYVVGRYNKSQISIYVNGVWEADTATTLIIGTNDKPLHIGISVPILSVQYYNGTMDEVRISNVARNASWINASYRTMNTPLTYIEVDAEEFNATSTWFNPDLENGNYWNDFDEASEGAYDNNSDGIIDQPYDNISGGNATDDYPLQHLFENYYILTITASSQVNEANQFTVTVKTQGETSVQDASVSFNNQTSPTDSNGQVTFTAPSVDTDTSYTITATKTGYTSASTTILVKNVPTNGGNPPGGSYTPTESHKPATPSLTGPTTGYVNVTNTYTANTTDPDGHPLKYNCSWGDGTYSWTNNIASGTPVSCSHAWKHTGAFLIKVKAQDATDTEESDWSSLLTVTITKLTNNTPPNTPNVPSGSILGCTYKNYSYSTSTTDPDNDKVQYRFDWDDGTISNWTTLVNSGVVQIVSHTWNIQGNYSIKAQARDSHNITSPWSSPLNITIELDTDRDGWSDTIEQSYGTNTSNPLEYPLDTDGDGIPDDPSPDGRYPGDPDDDNDGLTDTIEKALGSDPKNKDDVLSISYEGSTYYLIDTDVDNKYDTFYTLGGKITTLGYTDKGEYLIDLEGDNQWNYVYDPATSQIRLYEQESGFEFPWLFLIGLIVVVGIVTIVLALLFSSREKRGNQKQ
jgi:parallel beta-helix repeat protein